RSLARRAATLTARPHVRLEPRARGAVLIPGHIAGMVLGQADRPLPDRHINAADAHLAVLVEALLPALASEHERAGIGRVGQQVVHRAIVRPSPADAPLPDRAPRQLLALGDQLHHDLTPRAQTPPHARHALDRVTDLL